ncbi:energy transducer TonB [Erythrobacter sp. NE805]|uniref:energy transducer TonB n=1 Tax=Erythrobacter sp. NE805 TaxID=3389875 RepID=UPI00396B063F
MLARTLSCLLGFGVAASAVTPALAEPLRLKPTSGWELRAYDDKCRMIREFGSGEDVVTLWIDKGGPGPGLNLTLIGRPLRSPFGATIRVGFTPGELVERNFITAKSSKGRPVLGMFGVQPVSLLAETGSSGTLAEQPATGEESVDIAQSAASEMASEDTIKRRLARIDALELSGGVVDPITLELDRFLPMMGELRTCTEALVSRLQQNGPASGGRQAYPVDQRVWAAKLQENYPRHLALAQQQGSVGVRLTINKEGSPTFCEVISYSGPVSFNETACLLLLQNAKFDPARDSAGNPVASLWTTRITYKLRD